MRMLEVQYQPQAKVQAMRAEFSTYLRSIAQVLDTHGSQSVSFRYRQDLHRGQSIRRIRVRSRAEASR